jgi:Tfp pilus assembly protein PilV
MKSRKSREGFTLIEVVFALGLFVLALGALPGVLVRAVQSNGYARRLTTATHLAQDKLETIRNTPYTNVTSGQDQTTEGAITYTRQWTVSSGPTTTTRQVAVTVSWTDMMSRQVELDTIIGG